MASFNFTLASQNALYSFAGNKLSGWERDMLPRTKKFGSEKVLEKNLYWGVRSYRILNNLKINGDFPDVILLQEMSDGMLRSLLSSMPYSYEFAKSKVGMRSKGDGGCSVLWRRDVFRCIDRALHTSSSDRFVAAKLEHFDKKTQIVVASVHLPANGSAPTRPSFEKVHQMSDSQCVLSIIGGDFNVTYNPFSKYGFQNISGEQATFFNDTPKAIKLDWVVARGAYDSVSVDVNSVKPSRGRWPNIEEGSDHTSIRLQVQCQGNAPIGPRVPVQKRKVEGQFQSVANPKKYLRCTFHDDSATLVGVDKATRFELVGGAVKAQGKFVSINEPCQRSRIAFQPSPSPSLHWSGAEGVLCFADWRVDIYGKSSEYVRLWEQNSNNNQKWRWVS